MNMRLTSRNTPINAGNVSLVMKQQQRFHQHHSNQTQMLPNYHSQYKQDEDSHLRPFGHELQNIDQTTPI
jgi:hypothetical protein